jgi:hypothetical protein
VGLSPPRNPPLNNQQLLRCQPHPCPPCDFGCNNSIVLRGTLLFLTLSSFHRSCCGILLSAIITPCAGPYLWGVTLLGITLLDALPENGPAPRPPEKFDELDRLTTAQRAWVARRPQGVPWRVTKLVPLPIGCFVLLSAPSGGHAQEVLGSVFATLAQQESDIHYRFSPTSSVHQPTSGLASFASSCPRLPPSRSTHDTDAN